MGNFALPLGVIILFSFVKASALIALLGPFHNVPLNCSTRVPLLIHVCEFFWYKHIEDLTLNIDYDSSPRKWDSR